MDINIATAHKVEVNEGLLDIDKPETIVETTQKIFTPQLYEQLLNIKLKLLDFSRKVRLLHELHGLKSGELCQGILLKR